MRKPTDDDDVTLFGKETGYNQGRLTKVDNKKSPNLVTLVPCPFLGGTVWGVPIP